VIDCSPIFISSEKGFRTATFSPNLLQLLL
jgi:hypothetical protein